MPKIGARMIKTAIAVFLCFMIYLIRQAGIPFYSAIAAVLCTQPELADSKAKGKSRIIATLIGGFSGMVVLFLFRIYLPPDADFLRYTVISFLLVPLIYLTVAMKQPASSYLTCVVFMCICVSHGGDQDPFFFAINRMIDTFIGIFVALAVNAFHLPHRKHKEILIEVPFSYLLEQDTQLSTYTRIHINRILKEGASLIITSSQTPPYIIQRTRSIKEPLTYILMDGVLRYDSDTLCCQALHELPYELWSKVCVHLETQGYAPFLYEVKDELLYIHHGPYEKEVDQAFYEYQHKWVGHSYVSHESELTTCFHQPCIALLFLIEKKEVVDIERSLSPYLDEITWVLYEYPMDASYQCLRLYPSAIALRDPSVPLQLERQAKQVYKVRRQSVRSTKEVMKEIMHVFYHGGKL